MSEEVKKVVEEHPALKHMADEVQEVIDGLEGFRERVKEQRMKHLESIKAILADGRTRHLRLANPEISFPEDCDRIVRILAQYGIVCTKHEASTLWSRYSEGLCASWLVLPEDDQLLLESVLLEITPAELVDTVIIAELRADLAIGLEQAERGESRPVDIDEVIARVRQKRQGCDKEAVESYEKGKEQYKGALETLADDDKEAK